MAFLAKKSIDIAQCFRFSDATRSAMELFLGEFGGGALI
jgi:hypothetical protein